MCFGRQRSSCEHRLSKQACGLLNTCHDRERHGRRVPHFSGVHRGVVGEGHGVWLRETRGYIKIYHRFETGVHQQSARREDNRILCLLSSRHTLDELVLHTVKQMQR